MTTSPSSPSQLSYATPMPARRQGPSWMLIIMGALAVGFLVTDPYRMTAGFPADDAGPVMVRVFGGLIALGLVITGTKPLMRLAMAVIERFSTRQARPCFGICLTLIVCGTVCILASVAVELRAVRSDAMVALAVPETVNRSFGHIAIGGQSIFPGLFTAGLTFLAGCVLCAVGIWGSIANGPSPCAPDGEPAFRSE